MRLLYTKIVTNEKKDAATFKEAKQYVVIKSLGDF